jgi:hypothetical protein
MLPLLVLIKGRRPSISKLDATIWSSAAVMSPTRRQLAMGKYIKLTNLVHNKTGPDKPGAVYVNVDQICWVGVPVGAAEAYKTVVMMGGAFVNVKESVAEVMQLINSTPSS